MCNNTNIDTPGYKPIWSTWYRLIWICVILRILDIIWRFYDPLSLPQCCPCGFRSLLKHSLMENFWPPEKNAENSNLCRSFLHKDHILAPLRSPVPSTVPDMQDVLNISFLIKFLIGFGHRRARCQCEQMEKSVK